MKKFLFIFSLLFTPFMFAPFMFGQLLPLHICADTTELKNYDGSGIVLLDSYGRGDTKGGGLFHRVDSTYAEGYFAFDYKKLNGLQWARIGLFSPVVSAGENVFTTTATKDTVVIKGTVTSDVFLVSPEYVAGVDQQDVLEWTVKTDTLIVSRLASGESALKYSWAKLKTH